MSKLREAWDAMRKAAAPMMFQHTMEAAITEAEAENERLAKERDGALAVANAAAKGSIRALEACEAYREQRDTALAEIERLREALFSEIKDFSYAYTDAEIWEMVDRIQKGGDA